MSHWIRPLKTSAKHLGQVLASIFTDSTLTLESFPSGCAFFTKVLDSAAVLEVVALGVTAPLAPSLEEEVLSELAPKASLPMMFFFSSSMADVALRLGPYVSISS